MPPQIAASAAASRSASSSTISASLPPASISTGVSVSAHAAITCRAVAGDPVKATLSTPAAHERAAGLAVAGHDLEHRPAGDRLKEGPSASHSPMPGVYSLGLKTTALPAARA